MPLWSLSYEKIEEINKEKTDLERKIKTLESQTPKDLWKEDLDEFWEKYSKRLTAYIENENKEYLKVA